MEFYPKMCYLGEGSLPPEVVFKERMENYSDGREAWKAVSSDEGFLGVWAEGCENIAAFFEAAKENPIPYSENGSQRRVFHFVGVVGGGEEKDRLSRDYGVDIVVKGTEEYRDRARDFNFNSVFAGVTSGRSDLGMWLL